MCGCGYDTVPWTDYIERALSYLRYNTRGHDAALITRQPIFKGIQPSIAVTSTDADVLVKRHMSRVGDNEFPPLSWKNPAGTKETLLVVQDADSPFSTPSLHGLYYGLPPTLETLKSEYFSLSNPTYAAHGIRLGKNRRETVYTGPMPLLGHGEHRYFYQIVALNKPLEGLPEHGATYSEIVERLRKEDIAGWGEWVGRCERKP